MTMNLRKWLKILKLAVYSLLQHKLRAALSMLGIICGVMAVLAMLSIGEGAKRESLNQIEQLGTKNIYVKAIALTESQEAKARERRSNGLSSQDADRLLTGCRGIREIACLKEIKASLIGTIKDISPQIVACTPNYAGIQKLFVGQGRFITDEDITNNNQVCVIGENIANGLGLDGKPGALIRIESGLYKIAGVLKRYDRKTTKSSAIAARNYNDMIFIPLNTGEAFSQSKHGRTVMSNADLTELVVQMKTTEQVSRSLDIIKRIMEVSHGGVDDYQIIVPQELLRQSQKTQRTFNIVLGSIAFISLLVGGIGIMNIMLATVTERTKEIGIRRALGASQEDIVIHFLAESVLLTFSGGIIGILLGLLGVWVIAAAAEWKTAITLPSIILPLVMSICTGIFFGLYPAYSAARMDPIVALRHE